MELISREELRDRMYHEAYWVDNDMQKWDSGCWIRYKLFEKILDEMPTIESRPKGKWIYQPKFGRIECTACGYIFRSYVYPRKFCPNCGAEMRGEE